MDAGDFTGDPTIPGQKQTEALIEGMNQMHYAVAALSQRELTQGYDVFLARKAKAAFPFVSGNIVWQDTSETVVEPFVIHKVALRSGAKVKDTRIGFLGLTGGNPAFLKTGPAGRKIVTIDPVGAAATLVPLIRAKADLVVVLSSLDLESARNLARRVKDIDLIVGGSGAAQTRSDDFPEDTLIGRTRLMYIGDQGKNMGEVRLFFAGKGIAATTQRNVVGLTRDWPDDPDLAQLMSATKEQVNDYNRAQTEAQSPFAAPGAPGAAAPKMAAYTGSDRCLPCHEREFVVWGKSAHAHAFATLVREKQDFNPLCIGCHTVGYQKPQGFTSAVATPNLVNVGCESCHGPSSLHPETLSKAYGATSTEACRLCHTRENSPDFDPLTYIPKVQHWGDTKAAH